MTAPGVHSAQSAMMDSFLLAYTADCRQTLLCQCLRSRFMIIVFHKKDKFDVVKVTIEED